MKFAKVIFDLIVAAVVFVLSALLWMIGKALSLTLYVLSMVLGAASVLLGGIGKLAGIVVFVVTCISFAMSGFSLEVLTMLGLSILLVTSRQWLEKLAFLLTDISAAI